MEAPCPDKIWQDAGGAFGIGYVLMGTINLITGLRRSPKGLKLEFTARKMRSKTPKFGGNFAIWGTLFSGIDCSLAYIRKKEDTVNPIAAGALTGAILAARGGWKASTQAAAFGGVFIGLIEAFQHMMQRKMQQQHEEQQRAMIEERKKYEEEKKAREESRKQKKKQEKEKREM
ncbi:hypothetical protein DICPUDRAFT_153513 [Dictyostelium purpureum]|uniref:Mitochondrial import inner membrane translocase subunit TIM17 n=1 Tax=Dictyostelium purpureum TaxID=5786 RepID=F0ZP39_DICPU|nr:uncharacterized protein DICPUDRAFT_153513 [Dictyostelium purpureum]EGC34304.1 hypothetical protein DICPUDRAFT_153513 [Dictyostelium purpureum]|eukprot:XP_003289186.1 hypothetical protein DICPUDRAFT_153513 [Dictyostelium purpureum]